MTDYNPDRAAFQPVGEGIHVPDPALDHAAAGQSTRQRDASYSGGYPADQTNADRICVACGASISTEQRKCRFCLEHELDATSEPSAASPDQFLRGVIHFLVDARTSYAAVAKGTTAASFLTSNQDEPVDDCTLIDDLEDEPASRFVERWPTLPATAEVASAAGEQLLTTTRKRTVWNDDGTSTSTQTAIPRLYDERGQGIREEESLESLLDGHDQGWIVPAIALEIVTSDAESLSPRTEISTVAALECQHCTRETDHRFKTRESLPDETWTDQPIWECQVCGTARYGPAPDGAGS